MKSITKDFGAVKALDHVSLEVDRSEIHGLLGENGAGKSTLMNILAGTFPPTSGEIYLNGILQENMTTRKSNELGIRFIHQELNLVNDLKVYENLFLGEELRNKYGFLDKKEMINRSAEVFKRMNIDIDPQETVENLDTSRKQLVEIAKALLFESKLIIMDEPTTALTNKEIDNLFVIMRGLKAHGVSIIYISHKMPELFEICDRYTVLRDGKLIARGNFSDIDEKIATELLVGRSIQDENKENDNILGEVILQVQNLSCIPAFSDVSFELRKGEVLAITGLHGDGRGELAEALFGARPISGGRILFRNKPLQLNSINQVMKAGIGMVPRNRKERSIIKDMSILDNLSIAGFVNNRGPFVKKNEELKRFHRNKEAISIRVGSPYDSITSLSGGNQQKVIIARWLEIDSDIYILDNPTQGIDVGAKFEIYKIVHELAKKGKSIIVFSAEFPEIYKVADRCLVMYKGRITAELTRDELTEVEVMYYATGSNMEGVR
ncbi:sugar ABC transporter ATP-binding protein [Anaerosolibacter carboniphilus]|nr:sugar ABC transporter ATP-binding protein [Anaerosolibacter carboniphilus]